MTHQPAGVAANAQLSSSQPHFHILDGLRGVAALAVVVFHFMEWIFPDINENFIGHGFLAVDFFFCLSGFVIAYAYDHRIKNMGLGRFFRARLIRLHPLVILGSVLGLLGFLLDPFAGPADLSGQQLLIYFICSLFLIPYPMMEARGFNLFALNAPAWSLFWEYVANIFYAVLLVRLSNKIVALLTIVAGIGLLLVSHRAGNLLGGWSKDNFWDGGVRVAYSFPAGMLVYRLRWIIRNRLGFPGLALLLSLAFVMPGTTWNWITESLVVLFYFPLIVALGAGSSLAATTESICRFAGQISYPLYMTHYAGIWIFGNYLITAKPNSATLVWVVVAGILFLLLFAWLVMRFYDTPVRKFLTRYKK